jgi:AraC-like DNA-binding protein/ligand-binding sensor protein
MNANGHLIEALANSDMLQEYEQAYIEATGLPVALRSVETWQLPLHGRRRENPFCALMAGQSRTCAACLQMQEKLANGAMDRHCTMTCAYGLSETAVPVKLGGQTIGYLQTGQVMNEKPTPASFRRAIRHARKLGVNIDTTEARQAYFQSQVVPQKKMQALARLLAIFAEHLSGESNQISVQQNHAEPPIISKAKQYILDHASEDLSLEQVARAVNTSRFYFCKLFKQAATIHFTEFVSRVRLEKARNLLLNPNLRISEIAFEVGFQSLSHFNRVFKKFVGQSPTDYRNRLPAA